MLVQGKRLKEVVQQFQSDASRTHQQTLEDAETNNPFRISEASSVSHVAYLPLTEGLRKGDKSKSRAASRTNREVRLEKPDKRDPSHQSEAIAATGEITPKPSRALEGGTDACNAVTVIAELVAGASGVCSATGVQLHLGTGLEVAHSCRRVTDA